MIGTAATGVRRSGSRRTVGRRLSVWGWLSRCRAARRLQGVVRRAALLSEIRSGLSHQPLGDFPATYKRSESFFSDRLDLLREVARESGARNALDLGCAEGYFIRGLAIDPGLVGIGLESDWNALRKGLALRSLSSEENYAFVPMRFDAESIRSLPSFDLVICFWVLHHVIRNGGREAGVEFLKACADVTGKRFIFAMGGPLEEGSAVAAAKLAFLGGDDASIAEGMLQLLTEAGFQRCEIRAWAPVRSSSQVAASSARGVPIFVCEPPERVAAR
jgi:hypothetical protein